MDNDKKHSVSFKLFFIKAESIYYLILFYNLKVNSHERFL